MEEALDRMLRLNDWKGALEYVKKVQKKLLSGRVDMKDLIISNELRNDPSAYKVKNAVAYLAGMMQKRNPATAPKPGDRVPYVIVHKAKGTKKSECVEDPLYAIQHKSNVDYDAYNRFQLAKPIFRLFQFFPGITLELFTDGPHTKVKPPQELPAMFASMMKPQRICLVCNRPVEVQLSPVCVQCTKTKKDEVQVKIHKKQNKMRKVEKEKVDIWEGCRVCAGSDKAAEQCTARDCDKFYQRYSLIYNCERMTKDMHERRIFDW